MAQWGKNDAANNSVLWAPTSVKLAPNTDNRDALFGNTTADAFITGVTVGQYGVDDNEVAAGGGKVSHTGWVLQTTGSGGRAGRVMTEVLVAGGINTSPDAEDVSYPDYTIRIRTQPQAVTANVGDSFTFSVVATSTPSTTLSYQWEFSDDDGDTWSNASSTSASITGNDVQLASNDTLYRVVVSATGAINVTSSSALLTVVE